MLQESDSHHLNLRKQSGIRHAAGMFILLAWAPLLLFAPAILFSAQDQQDRQRGWPCASRIDPSYILITEGTGGQILMFQPSEASGSLILMESRFAGNEETVFRASGEMNGDREFAVTVDASIESITFSSFVQCMKMITYLTPSGEEVRVGVEGNRDHMFISGRILTVNKPQTGTWHVHVSGSGYFSVIADAKTDLTLDVQFVELGGRPGHEGYFPIQRMPKPGEEETLSIELSRSVRDVKFLLVDRESAPIRILDLPSVEGPQTEYLGPVILNAGSFRIMVQGEEEANGTHFQRTFPPLFSLQESPQ